MSKIHSITYYENIDKQIKIINMKRKERDVYKFFHKGIRFILFKNNIQKNFILVGKDPNEKSKNYYCFNVDCKNLTQENFIQITPKGVYKSNIKKRMEKIDLENFKEFIDKEYKKESQC